MPPTLGGWAAYGLLASGSAGDGEPLPWEAVEWFTADEYWIGRLVFQRALAAIYLVAFLVAVNQFRALLGSDGMLPIPDYLRRVPFRQAPSLFHWRYSDALFAAVARTGVGLAALTVLGLTDWLPLPAAMLVWLLLWALYLSIVNVGQRWYGFGWESLLLEAGFLAIFLGNSSTGPPLLMLVALRWLLFRLEFGAGLIKLRGDRCWRDLTCLYYHHETQPMPGPLSWYFHHLPRPLHRIEVLANHGTQLLVPFGLFLPQPVSGVCAGIMVVTQLWLVVSGNFAWLNWMAITLGLSVLPDAFWHRLLPIGPGPVAEVADGTPLWWVVLVCAVSAVVLVLSYRPARNLLSSHQAMNASFDSLHLVNTYGAFGSVGRVRYEIAVQGMAQPGPVDEPAWQTYEFKGKPTDRRRWPRQFAPYHLRLDWLMWFAAISPSYAMPWFPRFVERLLRGDAATLRLLHHNPFADRPPVVVRARLYRYRYTTWQERRSGHGCWERELVGDFMRPVTLEDF
ncbi:MAG: lipase maturation factor family protein [Intrasporangium sp.]|uniref:lipase maturation factor family protein n=1 Tax=Intrasporangium sp. TaxID=1925024 RepID=UPI002647CB81|nr:lipase maturation factor family protein [Intrasporangium sp.]MDN5796504.1 lipase maturation factor family protein [Intrasporangium sp.]